MATITDAPKTSRLDLRLTEDEKEQIERAAAICGISMSQWSISCLLDRARELILQSRTLSLSDEAFANFSQMLDEPMPASFAAFLDEEATSWE